MDTITIILFAVAMITAIIAIILAIVFRSQTSVGPTGATGATGPTGPSGSGVGFFEIINIPPTTFNINVLGLPGIVYYLSTNNDQSNLVIGLDGSIIVGQTFTINNLGPQQIPLVRAASGFTITQLPTSIASGEIINFRVTSPNSATVITI